jgi:hypothetical protein
MFQVGWPVDRIGLLLASALMCALVAEACVAAGQSPAPGSSALASAADPSSALSAQPSSFETPPSAEPSVEITPASPPGVGPAPSGRWVGMRWISVPDLLGLPASTFSDIRVFGWSGGFVAFSAYDPESFAAVGTTVTETLNVSSSPDGVHWTAGRPLDTAGLPYGVGIDRVAEGPSGLLAVGRFYAGACGGPPSVGALWTSTDGAAWTRVNFAGQFGRGTLWTADAGSAGYVATGNLSDGTTQILWLSDDGRSWRQVRIPQATFGTVVVQGATAFAGGYVVSGAVLGDEGCGGPALLTPSLWWSADGVAWSRAKLSGATPAASVWMQVKRISDRALLALRTSFDEATQTTMTAVWVSSDGKTWNAVSTPPTEAMADLYTDGQRCVSLIAPPVTSGESVVAAVGDDLRITDLVQSGAIPTELGVTGYMAALGPSGLLVVSRGGGNAWLGVPAAG